ncbi:MAG TPA: patatin-like phospholipase family protein [Bryobacteraceae bacterium]|nr:patatin-like phospholipase family protein [Bryobacteraceae bacterium]
MPRIDESVVVLGGGGIWGVAWMTGIILGLAEHGIDLTQARGFIGTSAGSIVGSQVAHGYSPAELFGRQTGPTRHPLEGQQPGGGLAQLMALVQRPWNDPDARTRAIAELALTASATGAPESPGEIAERLGVPSNDWPARPLSITAVDTATCALCVFNAQSGIGLMDAVAASCAVPGLRPPIPIQGRLYMDGGLWRNAENAHLARGQRSVLIVSPFGARMPAGSQSLQADIEMLRQSGTSVALIAADDEALATMTATGPLDPATRIPAANAGRVQGHREVEKIHTWTG